MKQLFIILIGIVLVTCSSCTGCSQSGQKRLAAENAAIAEYEAEEQAKKPTRMPAVMRARVLENNTITYCYLDSTQQLVYIPRDSVWLDMVTHRINDTSNTTMKVVLLPR
jgi:hypothetical protein